VRLTVYGSNIGSMAAESADGYVETSRTLTINGTTWTLSSNGTFTVTGGSGYTNILDMTTTNANTALVLKPNGAGGVAWGADATGSGVADTWAGSNNTWTGNQTLRGVSPKLTFIDTESPSATNYIQYIRAEGTPGVFAFNGAILNGPGDPVDGTDIGDRNYNDARNDGRYVPLARTVTINGAAGTLSSNLSFTVSGTFDAAAATNAAKAVARGAQTPYTLATSGTVTVPRAVGTNTFVLTCTGATTLAIATNSWTLAETGFFTIDANRGTNTLAFTTAHISGSTVLDVSASTLTPLYFRKPSGSYQWRVRQ